MKIAQLVLLISLFISFSACNTHEEQKPEKPNIILIMSDDMGYSDIGCYGGEINTPTLDTLAANGLRFTQFYNTARCCPTRASLLTGLYQHQAGIGHMTNDRGSDAYRGDLSQNALTIAEVLKEAGYTTYMSGKWHVTPYSPNDSIQKKHNWPLQRGFDRFFGTILGAGSFYDPCSLVEGNEYITPGENFYYTDAISNKAVDFIEAHDNKTPFFMYVPYTAAHWPMHAKPEDIAKYKGKFDDGWDKLRERKYKRLLEMGLINEGAKLSEKVDIPDWQETDHKEWYSQLMEVYAAMTDCMDQGIGRIIHALDKKGLKSNTLVFFLQDNGGCAEEFGFSANIVPFHKDVIANEIKPMEKGELQTNMVPKYTRDGKPLLIGKGLTPGGADTFLGYGRPWANASNTPFRMYKHWVHEGGIATPLIVHWPEGIQAKNELRHTPGHLIDIMATCVDVAGATYPTQFNNNSITPMEGQSLFPVFGNQPLDERPIFWEHEGNKAVRLGKFKLVSRYTETSEYNWELYNLETDRSELNDRINDYPEKAKELEQLWKEWAQKVGVRTWKDKQPIL